MATLKNAFRNVNSDSKSQKQTDAAPSKVQAGKARLRELAGHPNAKIGYSVVAFSAFCLVLHAAQVAITKKILLS